MNDNVNVPASGMPRINEAAPHFEAKTTRGMKQLAEHPGKRLVLPLTIDGPRRKAAFERTRYVERLRAAT